MLHRLGQPRQAGHCLCRALRGGIHVQASKLLERAVELYALASRHLPVAGSRWFEDLFGRHIAAAAAALPPGAVVAAQERGRAGDLCAMAAELLTELGG